MHWTIPGYAQDDPAPGGAFVIAQYRDGRGKRWIRLNYRAQPLDALRKGGAPVEVAVPVPGCPALCPAEAFLARLER